MDSLLAPWLNRLKVFVHDVEAMEKEGHWLIDQDSNFEVYRTIEAFLARHFIDGADGGLARWGRRER